MKPNSKSSVIAAELRDEILRGHYRSGERLPSERDLADRFGVHRSAVREALKRLETLGLADIRPGGARAAPLEEASLDVVEHLLQLEDPPNLEIVDQALEAMSGLFTTSARLVAERASPEQRQVIRALLDKLAAPEIDASEHVLLVHELGDRMVEATGNIVLKLMRRGFRRHILERIGRDPVEMPAPAWLRVPLVRNIAKAIEAQDGAAASEATYALTCAMRRHTLDTLRAERKALDSAGGTSS
jgi:DNA-binding FadR family transcriptional regulator